MNRSQHIWLCCFLLLAGFAGADSCGGGESTKRTEPHHLAALVRQLGSADFNAREEASRQLLKIGLPARQALEQGAKDHDLEIRRRCRELMPAILEADRQAKLAAFIADKDGKQKHDLPGWDRYRKIAGSDADARQFFIALQKADTGFLAEVEKDLAGAEQKRARAGERCGQQCQNLVNRQQAQRSRNGRPAWISPEEIAPLLLVCTDPSVSISLHHRHLFSILLSQSAVQTELRTSRSTPFKKIILAWMEQQAGEDATASMIFQTINNLQLKEGLDLALKTVRRKTIKGSGLGQALVTIGRLGGKQHSALLESFLEDKTQICGFGIGRVVGGKARNVQGNTEVRDVALAMLVRLTKQSFKDYDFAISGSEADHLMFNANFLGFSSDKERDKAFAKWKAWKAAQKK